MKMQDKSKNLTSSKQYVNPVLFVACFAAGAMAIFASVSLYPGIALGQESGESEVGAVQNATNMSSSVSNSSLVDFDSNIEQIRGHLEQAVANKEIGNTTLAKAHTLHPIEEIYSSIEVQIDVADPGLNQSLSSSLGQLSNMVDKSTVEEFKTKASDINGLLNDTVGKVIPVQEINDSGFNLAVVGDLLSVANNEYKEAIENGQLKEIVEYQDGQAFISRANSIFNEFSPLIPQDRSADIPVIIGFFSDLGNAVQEKSNPDVVSSAIGSIIHEISEVSGISEENISGTSSDTSAYIPEIRNLLNQTLDAYRNQNYDEADALAIQAYLDNYEFVEAPLAEQNRTLMETTELMLREDLRQLIQTHEPIEEIQEHIDKINSNLNQAEELLAASG
jgi:antitoxin component HigA of HigAB toxin-antitoxin module